MELFYREAGENGRPMVIMHGLFGSCDNWFTLAKVLAEKHKVYVVDARNHGRSPHSEEMSYGAMADDLADFIKEKGLEAPIVLGHSMGGKAVMTLAAKSPKLIGKLVVADIAPKQYPLHHQEIIAAMNSMDLRATDSRNAAEEHLARFIPEADVRQFLLKSLYRGEDKYFAWRFNLKVLARDIARLVEPIHLPVPPFDKDALFIRGENSNYVLPEDYEPIRASFPKARFVTIKGAGHWLHADKPQEFVAALLAFAARG